jgi:diphthamide biosynthesis methyltransferase
MKILYKSLDVYDKTSFMSAYAGYTILLKSQSEDSAEVFVDSDEIVSKRV